MHRPRSEVLDHAEWLHDRVRANLPDVLFLGPLYKLASGRRSPASQGCRRWNSKRCTSCPLKRCTFSASARRRAGSPSGCSAPISRPLSRSTRLPRWRECRAGLVGDRGLTDGHYSPSRRRPRVPGRPALSCAREFQSNCVRNVSDPRQVRRDRSPQHTGNPRHNRCFRSGRCRDRTCDLCRVKAALSR